MLRGEVFLGVFRRRKHDLKCSLARDIPLVVRVNHAPDQTKIPRVRRCGRLVALACLLLLAVATSLVPTAGAAPAGTHGAVHAAIASKARKKKQPTPPTIKMKLLGSVAPETPENANDQQGWLYTDGVRWAAYEATAGVTRLIETLKNKTIERPDPEGCADGLIALGGGEMLYRCEDPECPEHERRCSLPSNNKLTAARYIVEDIQSGEQHPVTGENALPDNGDEGGPSGLYQIGSQWAKGGIGGHFGGDEFFLNWHTGRLVWEREEASEENVENLSNPNLTQRLCKPITRPKNRGEYQSTAYAPVQYEPPFTVVGPLEEAEAHVPLQLHKCGSGKRILLPPGGSAQLGGRVLSWVGNGPIVTPLYTNGRKWHGPYYKLGGLPPETGGVVSFVQHTLNMVFATLKPGLGPAQVYIARLPWALLAK